MAFPDKILGIAIGWKDRGLVGVNYDGDHNETYTAHSFCRTRARIGIENEEIFLFCPKCLCKIDLN